VIDAERLAQRAGDGPPREILHRIALDIERDMAAPIASLAREPDDEDASRIRAPESKTAQLRRTRSDGKA
jgi:hypothetical protein